MSQSSGAFDAWLREDRGPVTVVRFMMRRIVDPGAIDSIDESLTELVDDQGRIRLVLDLGKVEFSSSTFLGKVVWLFSKVRRLGGRLAVCDLSPSFERVLQPTPDFCPERLAFFHDVDQAVEWAGRD